ncbi:MAG TPA: bifunctional lysylphosphatidylglycerol flippase/synthetase MprF, partial [Anaerovoracaceae bacterium]|nr:bifunctional lysylphosphatidylglycerol flippase/synthetase MprF [Anaerovoracaceae bacterium]
MNIIKRIRVFILKHYKTLLKFAFALALISLILFEGKSQIQSIHPAATLHTMRAIPIEWIILFLIVGMIASISMVLYDVFGMKSFQYEIEKKDLVSISFVANSLNTLLGFGGLTGPAIKAMLLRKRSIEPKEMISYNAVLVSSATTGLSFLTILTLFNYHNILPLINQHKWLLVCLIGSSLYLIGYFFLDKVLKQFKTWSADFGLSKLFKLRLELLAVSILEWGLACALFYTLAFYFHRDLSFINIMSVFAIASIAGILSFLPGGVGSFDLIAIIGLQLIGLTPNEALVVVIMYRVFYYIIPSGTAIVIFSLQVLKRTEQKGYVIKSDVYGQFVATLMAIVVVTCGMLLLISALTPSLISRSRLITNMESAVFLHYSRSISIAIGFMLLFTAKEVFLRVKRAYHVTMILLLLGGIFTFIKGLDIEELLFILIAMGVMRLSKTNFYRKSILIKPSHLIAAGVGVFALLIVYLKISHILFSSYIKTFHYPHFIFHDIHTFISSGLIAYTLFIIYVVVWYLKRDRIEKDSRYQSLDPNKLELHFQKYKGHHLSHLIYLGDKHLYWAVQDQVLIAYSKYADKVVVLGDPIGEKSLFTEGIQEFQRFIDVYGYRTVFYEVDEENLSMYHDNGFYFFKLGEEAVVNLDEFNMEGSSHRTFRNVVNRFAKDGFSFEVLSPPFQNELLDELELISSEWLGNRKEMGFSLGWFNRDYLQKAPIAIVKNQANNGIIAFVSIIFQDKDHTG